MTPKIVQVHDGEYFLDGFDPKQLYLHEVIEALVSKKSEFQQIDIFRTVKYGKVLTLDGFPQIAEIGDSYTEALVIPALFFHRNPGRILVLGGGDGPALALVLKDPRVKEVVLVDIDPLVVALTQKHLPELWGDAASDPRVTIVYKDALKFLRENGDRFDVIISDLVDPEEGAVAAHLMSPEYFGMCAANLFTDGIFAMQAGELTPQKFAGHKKTLGLVNCSFKEHRSYSVHVPWFSTVWSFIVARNPAVYRNPLGVHDLGFLYPEAHAPALFRARGEFAENLKHLDSQTFGALFAVPKVIKKNLAG